MNHKGKSDFTWRACNGENVHSDIHPVKINGCRRPFFSVLHAELGCKPERNLPRVERIWMQRPFSLHRMPKECVD